MARPDERPSREAEREAICCALDNIKIEYPPERWRDEKPEHLIAHAIASVRDRIRRGDFARCDRRKGGRARVSENLIEGMLRQMNRARELVKQYEAIGPAGAFGKAAIEQTIREGEAAIASGDVIRMLAAYKALESNE